MHIDYDRKLDFKDVLIRPKRSTLRSRADVDITRSFRFIHTGLEWTGFPLIASNMDAIGTFSMARAKAHPAVPGRSICSMRVPCAGDQRRAGGDMRG